MGILSSSVSITRYKVEGSLKPPIMETVAAELSRHAISEITENSVNTSVGWTSINHPFQPEFSDLSFVFGSLFIFSLRIDKKTIPPKLLKKHVAIETSKRLQAGGRDYLSQNEKKLLKEEVVQKLAQRIPAIPNVYDVIWNFDQGSLWFFSNLRKSNEELETLFTNSFHLTLLRLFPFTFADLMAGLSDSGRDSLIKLSPTNFSQ
jgi:recombination associated protein RdgC